MTHPDIHIYQTNQNQTHIPGSTPPIRDFTPSGRPDSHPDCQGATYVTLTTVLQTQTWTHMPKEQTTSVHHGQMLLNQAECPNKSNHPSLIQYVSPVVYNHFSFISIMPTTCLTYICTESCPHSHITHHHWCEGNTDDEATTKRYPRR